MKKHLLTLALAALTLTATGADEEASTFWGCRLAASGWPATTGLFTYQYKAPFAMQDVLRDQYFSAGLAYQDDILYGIEYTAGTWYMAESAKITRINPATWTISGTTTLDLSKQRRLVPLELARAADGTTYGVFRTDANGTYEFGVVNYANMTRTTFGTTTHYYIALGVTTSDILYGIDKEGNLYRIDTTNGAETLVGNTGVKIGGTYTSPEEYPTSGEINPIDNTFYWAYTTSEYGAKAYLYTVDLATAKATSIHEYAEGDQITGMLFPVAKLAEGVPAPATNLAAHFEADALEGTFEFTVADTTNVGTPLTGSVDYTIEVGADTQKGVTTAGQHVRVGIRATEAGLLNIRLTQANDKGKAHPQTLSVWVGNDVPVAPGDVAADIDADNNATITWQPPTQGAHDGYIGQLTYNVYRVLGSQTTLIASAVSATTATDRVEVSGNAKVRYEVEAINAGLTGERASSQEYIVGSAYGVPFTDSFDRNTKREYFAIIDANHDGATIDRHYTASMLPGFYPDTDFEEMQYNSNSAKKRADDWMITPKIRLERGHVYTFSIDARVSFDDYTQRVELCMGRGQTAADMTTRLLAPTDLTGSAVRTLVGEFMAEETGVYYFGIHVLSDAANEYLYFDNVSVRESTEATAPARVSDLSVAADAEGLLSADVTFTAPTTTIGGEALEALTKVEISRESTLIATQTDVRPGQTVTYTDAAPANGYNVYTIVAYNASGKGLRAVSDSVYVGVDVPLAPGDIHVANVDGRLRFTWPATSTVGQHGYIVRRDGVSYELCRLNSSYEYDATLFEGNGLAYDYSFDADRGDQDLTRFGVRCTNRAGYSGFRTTRIVTGAPYNLPFHESFATGTGHALNWMEGSGDFEITTACASDGDAGCVRYEPGYDGEKTSFNLGKMSMRQALHPRMTFVYRGTTDGDALYVRMARPDGTEDTLTTVRGAAADWRLVSVDLSAYAGTAYVIPKILVRGSKGQVVYIDDINIIDPSTDDLALSLTAPAKAAADGSALVHVEVTNVGLNPVADYSIDIRVDGRLRQSTYFTESLAVGESRQHDFPVDVRSAEGTLMGVSATVRYPYDLNPSNDVASAMIAIVGAGDMPGADAADTSDAITDVTTAGALVSTAHPQDIFTTSGQLVRRHATSLRDLKPGLYIVGGRKVSIR